MTTERARLLVVDDDAELRELAQAYLKQQGFDVETVAGRYGEFKVFVDGKEVLSAGPLAFIGVLPSIDDVREAVKMAQSDEQRP